MRITRPGPGPGPTLSGSISHPMLGETVNYSAQPVRDDPDGQVADTLRIMGRYAMEDAGSPQVLDDARQCVGSSEMDSVAKVWGLTQKKIQFVRDEAMAEPLSNVLANGEIVEILIRPRDMAGLKNIRIGDCDDYSMYAASLLTALGIPCAFVTVAGDDKHPGRFTHVYVAAYPLGGDGSRRRVALDASHGPAIGWEATQLKPWARVKDWMIEPSMAACEGVGGGMGAVLTAALFAGAGWLAWQMYKGRTIFGIGI